MSDIIAARTIAPPLSVGVQNHFPLAFSSMNAVCPLHCWEWSITRMTFPEHFVPLLATAIPGISNVKSSNSVFILYLPNRIESDLANSMI
ncbi:hypothetical protein K6Q96_06835 [Grimontia kaedaensis]|uniref:Uncharacterized protein n=1 Tax=Grimontia kaedaensis TaxID=2872157 RepID=A0ABY4WXJ0_9GAMM|nr:hypothetical protein [Grimontia kaedaensis]USH03702.1 hypothetical protein K6Q96_06835 [Grimontia kaedaensis]